MLILGIETATAQVGVAIGGHEGVIASFHSTRDRPKWESMSLGAQQLWSHTTLETKDR